MAAPVVSQEDLSSFHATHFSSVSLNHFSENFLGPVEESYEEGDFVEAEYEDVDDGLGYYEDGTKRTLTDEQIAMFRHSEIQTLLRERRHAEEAREFDGHSPEVPKTPAEDADLEDGELEEGNGGMYTPAAAPAPPPPPPPAQLAKNGKKSSKKEKKVQFAKEKGFFKQKIKPDLRKRTWDKVDSGLDGLDYDEGTGSSRAPSMASQRRKISYDDD